MSDAFLVLAQAAGGLSCFFVPRVLPDGSRNVFRIQRLKDKLGNRSNASSEVEFDGTDGWLVGDEGRGVATIVQMVTRTRLDCVLGTAAGMRQAVAEAAWHVRHRRAFGSLLVDQPAMTAVVADLALESEAATITAMRLARAYDDDASDVERAFRRLATAVAKYWVCKRGPEHAYEALECLGGNGYTEGFPLARRYREQPLLAIWEGSGNVIALDVLRVLEREPDAFEAFFSWPARPRASTRRSTSSSPKRGRSWPRSGERMPRPRPCAPASSPSDSRSCCRRRCSCSMLRPRWRRLRALADRRSRGVALRLLPSGVDLAAILARA
ncbi:acyl-CoA dehydrogenase family protein [Agromyces flavus]|uniref:acyl-CoA dehydrogenase family protein n=1 Tax=Agromyces flavus TaxID=589382 RepID=UPI000A76CA8F|nr:acyl-CoA dehydrogenase family protein [Agromyces flavus]